MPAPTSYRPAYFRARVRAPQVAATAVGATPVLASGLAAGVARGILAVHAPEAALRKSQALLEHSVAAKAPAGTVFMFACLRKHNA